MKKVLLIIAVLLSVNCTAQNRFDKEFTKADSAFTQRSDSVKFSQAIKEMNDTTKITLTVDQCLQIYLTGYLNGAFDYMQKGSFDIDGLWKGMIKNHRSIRFNAKLRDEDKVFLNKAKKEVDEMYRNEWKITLTVESIRNDHDVIMKDQLGSTYVMSVENAYGDAYFPGTVIFFNNLKRP